MEKLVSEKESLLFTERKRLNNEVVQKDLYAKENSEPKVLSYVWMRREGKHRVK